MTDDFDPDRERRAEAQRLRDLRLIEAVENRRSAEEDFTPASTATAVLDRTRVQPRHGGQRRAQRRRQQIVRPLMAEEPLMRLADRRARGGNDISVLNLFHIGSRVMH